MELIDQIKRDEGLRLTPYKDSVGVLTIGYGTNLDEGITRDEAEYLLKNRLHAKQIELAQRFPWVTGLDQARQDVLANMSYNVGVPGLGKFVKFLGMVKSGDYANAAIEMLNSLWARQVGERAVRLSNQMREGCSQ